MQAQGAVMSLSDFTNCKQNGAEEENDTEKKTKFQMNKYELFKRTCSVYKMQFAVSILIQYYVESGFWSVDRQDTASDLFSCSPTCCRLQCTGRWHCSLVQTGDTGSRSDKQRSGPLMVTSNHLNGISRSYSPDRWHVCLGGTVFLHGE